MTRHVAILSVAVVLTFTLLGAALLAAAVPPESVPKDIATPALGYAHALVRGDLTSSWRLLSSPSRAATDAAKWEEAFRTSPPARTPSPNALLKALATADPPAAAGNVLVLGSEALVQVSGTVQIERTVVLVKEGNRWLVDLAATDEANSREAAQTFLEAVAADAGVSTPRPVRAPQTNLPMLRALLAPEAKDYRVSQAKMRGDRAYVTLVADLPVNLVLRTTRQGPGWQVDLSRPLVSTKPTSPDPLREAAGVAKQADCQEQLRRLAQAIQMYTSLSADMLPDPDHWVDQIRPYLGNPADLHCPADPTPGVSYAMNRNLAGKTRAEVGNPALTPLLYESTLHTVNPADTGETWPTPAVHADGNLVLYLDGSVRPSQQPPSFNLTTPAEAPAVSKPAVTPRRPTLRPVRPAPGR